MLCSLSVTTKSETGDTVVLYPVSHKAFAFTATTF